MQSFFNLDLENKTDPEVRAMGGTFITKINGSTYFSSLDTNPLGKAIDALKTADDNKGTGTKSTTTASKQRVNVDYQFNAIVGLINTQIADPSILPADKELMKEDTGLTHRKETKREKDKFEFHQLNAESPAYLGAQGIKGGSGLHQWQITTDTVAHTNLELLDPTETGEIELTTVLPKTEYAATHRTRKNGIFSAWEPFITFMTL